MSGPHQTSYCPCYPYIRSSGDRPTTPSISMRRGSYQGRLSTRGRWLFRLLILAKSYSSTISTVLTFLRLPFLFGPRPRLRMNGFKRSCRRICLILFWPRRVSRNQNRRVYSQNGRIFPLFPFILRRFDLFGKPCRAPHRKCFFSFHPYRKTVLLERVYFHATRFRLCGGWTPR